MTILIEEEPATNELIFQKKRILPNMDSVILGKRCHLLAVFGVKSGSVLFERIWASCFQRCLPGSRCTANSGQSSSIPHILQKNSRNMTHSNTHFKLVIYCNKQGKCAWLKREKSSINIITLAQVTQQTPDTNSTQIWDMYSGQLFLWHNNAHLYLNCKQQTKVVWS